VKIRKWLKWFMMEISGGGGGGGGPQTVRRHVSTDESYISFAL